MPSTQVSDPETQRLIGLTSDLADALSAEIEWRGEIGSDEHLLVTGDVIRARDALALAVRLDDRHELTEVEAGWLDEFDSFQAETQTDVGYARSKHGGLK